MLRHDSIDPNTIYSFTVAENNEPCRIDSYITQQLPFYSRNYFQGIINQSRVTVNGTITQKPSCIVRPTDIITVQFPAKRITEAKTVVDKTMGVSILAETDHFLIIHKPAHLLVHAPSLTSKAITLSDWIRLYDENISSVGAIDRPGVIHRLDKETSGILVITRTDYAHNAFGKLFRERNINKTYKAIVEGHPDKEGTITLAIGRDPINRIKMKAFNPEYIDENGRIGDVKVRTARTDYKVLEYFKDTSLIEVKPTTGRTHQIRVHMAAIGHAVVGDRFYGKESRFIDRQALHAESLSFDFIEKKYFFSDEIPDDFQKLITHLRQAQTVI